MSSVNLPLDKLMASEANYEKIIKEVLETIRKDKDIPAALRNVILFCKHAFSVGSTQRKFLALTLIRDISEVFKIPEFQRTLDDNVPIKILKMISGELSQQGRDSRSKEELEYAERMVRFAIETISFWTKKLSFLSAKSQFGEAYEELKKMRVEVPKKYEFYRADKLALGLWGDREENSEEFVKNEEMSPLIGELFDKFTDCKALIEERVNEAVLNEEEIHLKAITEKLRDFLLAFFAKYKSLQAETSLDRDVLVVYFHIANSLFKRISNRFYVPAQEMIQLTKEIFEGDHSTDFSSVDRIDIINLAGIHKYNALTVFQRIHSRIELQEAKLGPCELTFEQKDVLVYANQKAATAKPKEERPREEERKPKFKR